MRVAVINEIHGNLAALEAALARIDEVVPAVERVVSTGDLVGTGPNPNEVIDLLREHRIESVRGNYDDAIAFDRSSSGVDFADRASEAADREALKRTREALTEENLAYLRALPRDMRLSPALSGVRVTRNSGDEKSNEYRRNFLLRSVFGGLVSRQPRTQSKRILVVHGSTRALNEFVRGDTANSILQTVAREAEAEVLITGHAGIVFHREVEGVTFVGAGSICGRQSKAGAAEFAVVEITDTVKVDTGRAPYGSLETVEINGGAALGGGSGDGFRPRSS